MKPFARGAVGFCVWLQFCCAAAVARPQTPKALDCDSISGALVAQKVPNNIHFPVAAAALLEADVPVGGKPISVEIMARKMNPATLRGDGPWQECTPNAYCLGVFVPAGVSISNHGVDPYDGKSFHYGVLVWSGPWRSAVFMRLVLKYATDAEFCVSQVSWEADQNAFSPKPLMIPEGKTPLGFNTFATVLYGAGEIAQPNWNNCDIWDYPGPYLKKDQCDQGSPDHNPGVIGFINEFIDEDGYITGASTARGFYFICNNRHFNRRACRAQLRYK